MMWGEANLTSINSLRTSKLLFTRCAEVNYLTPVDMDSVFSGLISRGNFPPLTFSFFFTFIIFFPFLTVLYFEAFFCNPPFSLLPLVLTLFSHCYSLLFLPRSSFPYVKVPCTPLFPFHLLIFHHLKFPHSRFFGHLL